MQLSHVTAFWLRLAGNILLDLFLYVHIVLVQPEMEVAFPVSEYSALRAGIFKASMRPPGYPSAWLRPRRACFRFTRQNHCSSTTSIRLNFRLARDSPQIGLVRD